MVVEKENLNQSSVNDNSLLTNSEMVIRGNNYRISVGAEILYITTDGKESQVGLNVPIYLKYWYEQ